MSTQKPTQEQMSADIQGYADIIKRQFEQLRAQNEQFFLENPPFEEHYLDTESTMGIFLIRGAVFYSHKPAGGNYDMHKMFEVPEQVRKFIHDSGMGAA